jgi:hypothetical protein
MQNTTQHQTVQIAQVRMFPDLVAPTQPAIVVKRYGNTNEVKFQYTDAFTAGPQERKIIAADAINNHYGIVVSRPELLVLNVGSLRDPQYLPLAPQHGSTTTTRW